MNRYGISAQARAIIQRLLAEKGILRYEITDEITEEKMLPGEGDVSEIASLSGVIVTPSTAYHFWLDWVDGHYTLGDAKGEGYWSEISPGSSWLAGVTKIRQRLREQTDDPPI